MFDSASPAHWLLTFGIFVLACIGISLSASARRDRRRNSNLFVEKDKLQIWSERDACPKFSQIPIRSDRSMPHAMWPPVNKPAQAIPVQDLMAINSTLIRDLCYASKLTESEYEAYLLPVIANLAHVVHLLPASAYDHHQGYGGLFVHSLEVAYYAANQAKNTIFDRTSTPKEIHWNRRRWILTCILAALVHDCGKPYTDIEVTSDDGKSWPKTMPLLDWLRHEGLFDYYVTFRSERTHNEHVSVAVQKLEALIPAQTFAFLGSTGVGERMQEALRNALNLGAKGGLVGKIVSSADGLSRETDSLRQRQIHPVYKNVSHPQGDPLLKALRALVNSGKWTANFCADSQIFNPRNGCYVAWSEESAKALWAQATSMGFTGLPQNPSKIAEILIDSKAALPNTSADGELYSNLWNITPIFLKEGEITCLRMADPQFVFDNTAPVPIDCIVEGIPLDEITEQAWWDKWKCKPIQKLSPEEELESGLDADSVRSEIEAALIREEEMEALDVLSQEDVWTDAPPFSLSQEENMFAASTPLSSEPSPVEVDPRINFDDIEALLDAHKPLSQRSTEQCAEVENAIQKAHEAQPSLSSSSSSALTQRGRLEGEDVPIPQDERLGPALPPCNRAGKSVENSIDHVDHFERETRSLADNFSSALPTKSASKGSKGNFSSAPQRQKHLTPRTSQEHSRAASDDFSEDFPLPPIKGTMERAVIRLESSTLSSPSTPLASSEATSSSLEVSRLEQQNVSAAQTSPSEAANIGSGITVEKTNMERASTPPMANPVEDPSSVIENTFLNGCGESAEGGDSEDVPGTTSQILSGSTELRPSSAGEVVTANTFPLEIQEKDAAGDSGTKNNQGSLPSLSHDSSRDLQAPNEHGQGSTFSRMPTPAAITERRRETQEQASNRNDIDVHAGSASLMTVDWRDDVTLSLAAGPAESTSFLSDQGQAERNPAKKSRTSTKPKKRRLSFSKQEELAQAAEEKLLEQMVKGHGEWIPDGVRDELGSRAADLAHFASIMKIDDIDLSFVSAIAARRRTKPRLLLDLKRQLVFLDV